MKNLIFFLLFLFISVSNIQAQEVSKEDQAKEAKLLELMSIKIDMDIDEELFVEVTPNTFVSESPKSVIMAMVVPQTYEKAKESMSSGQSADFKVEKRGEMEIEGISVLFMEGTSVAEGSTLVSKVYCLQYDEENCIMAMGMVEDNASKAYFDAVEKALKSVVKKY